MRNASTSTLDEPREEEVLGSRDSEPGLIRGGALKISLPFSPLFIYRVNFNSMEITKTTFYDFLFRFLSSKHMSFKMLIKFVRFH